MKLATLVAPSGFGTASALAALLAFVGVGQLASLFVREEPYRLTAALFALLLIASAALLGWFIYDNRPAFAEGPRSREAAPGLRGRVPDLIRGATARGLLLVLASVLVVVLAAHLWIADDASLPLRMLLFGPGGRAPDLTRDRPLPMLVAGTLVLSLGVAAVCICVTAVWTLLYRAGSARAMAAIERGLNVASALPFVAVALLLRLWFGGDVARLAAERWLENPDGKLAFASLLGMAPGFFWGSLALGLQASHGLWLWLDRVRAEEEGSDSFFLMVHVRRLPAFRVLLRQGLWLRRRRDFAAILLGAAAAAALVDILSNTILDAVGPGFPLAPTLGASLFLRQPGQPLPPDWATTHQLVFLIGCCILVAQALRPAAPTATLHGGALTVAGRVLATGVPAPEELVQWPHLQWLLGVSGSGKSSLLRCWAAMDDHTLLVPQDPDEALSPVLSAAELGSLAEAASGDEELLADLLTRLDDARVRRGLGDPFTTVAVFSRGERQRLAFSLALVRAARTTGLSLLIDEPTSGQDAARGRRMMACLAELAAHDGEGRTIVTSHDPEFVAESLALGRTEAQDDVVWIEGGQAHRLFVDPEATDWKWATQPGEARLPGLLEFQEAMRTMLVHGDPERATPPAPERVPPRRFPLLGPCVSRAGYRFEIDESRLRIGAGELAILSGPSGAGKSTLLRQMTEPLRDEVTVGWVPQELARALPPETPVGEALQARTLSGKEREIVLEWYGQGFRDELLRRPVGSLSEGERQRVLLTAEVLRLERIGSASRLRLLLMDEPFGSADPAGHLRMMEALARWLSRPLLPNAAVLVSHSPAADSSLARSFRVPVVEWRVEGGER